MRQAQARPAAAGFRAGEHDVPVRLLPPSRLAGREDDVAALEAAFADALAGQCRGALVSGAPGVFGTGIPAASGKVAKDPITGDTQPEYKSQGTEGHGLPFVSFVGGVTGGILGGAGGTLIYIELLSLYKATLPTVMNVTAAQALPIAISVAGTFAIGLFLVNAVLTAYNITGTIEGPHDPKFKRWPRAIVASAVASALCGLVAILIVTI